MNPILDESMTDRTSVDDRAEAPPASAVNHRLVDHARREKPALRRLARPAMLVVALIGGIAFGLYKMRVDIPQLNTTKMYASIDSIGARAERLKGRAVAQYESYFHKEKGKEAAEGAHHEGHKIVVTSPLAKDVIITQEYVCQIHSQKHIDVQALDSGYLEAIPVREGQAVRKGDLMFQINSILYRAKLEAEVAKVQLAQYEYNNTENLSNGVTKAVSKNEVLLFKAKLAEAEAKKKQAEAELNFATLRAPFDGIVDRLHEQQGSLVKEGDILTTLSDNNVMWVYFNVPERDYLGYMSELDQDGESSTMELRLAKLNTLHHIELRLATLNKFPQPGRIGTIEAQFNPETGNIAFRADFPNPTGLLRHGQTGSVVISRELKGAIVIPQRATFENLAKRYVYAVGKDDVVHQREVAIQNTLEDIFVIGSGVDAGDRIVLQGITQVRDGEKVEYEFQPPEQVMANQKNHAE